MSQLATPLLAVLSLGASPGEMGVLRAVNFTPYLLSLPVGVLVDRTRRRPVLIGVDLLRALLLGSIPLAAVLGVLALPQLYVVAALSGALTLVFGVAYTAYLPGLVSSSRLMDANARLELSRSAAHAAGPGLAGALVQALSASAAILEGRAATHLETWRGRAIAAGDVVLVKASCGARRDEVAAALAWFGGAAGG